MSLSETRGRLISEIQDGVGAIAGKAAGVELGEICEKLSEQFQALGGCNLLLTADPAGLHRNLLTSAFTRRYHLRRNADLIPADHYLAISRSEALFDALACAAWELAQELIRLSPQAWIPDGEYEDDYWYYRFLHDYIAGGGVPKNARLAPDLVEFERALEGSASARLAVCRALLERDAAGFADAFAALLVEHQAQLEVLKPHRGDDPAFAAQSALFVEGLGLLWLAERAGFPTELEYVHCPQLARTGLPAPMPVDLYVELDRMANA